MPMLRICSAEGCVTKTLGDLCIRHEPVRTAIKRPTIRVTDRAAA